MHKTALLSKMVVLLAFVMITLMAINAPFCFAQEPSIEALQEEVKQGKPAPQFLLGMAYVQGKGITKDYKQAALWFRKAAKQGHAGAQYNLGVMHALGEGMKQDYTQAATWYQKAADQGHIDAQYNLGLMFYDGQGVEQNYKEAAKLLRSVAIYAHEPRK